MRITFRRSRIPHGARETIQFGPFGEFPQECYNCCSIGAKPRCRRQVIGDMRLNRGRVGIMIRCTVRWQRYVPMALGTLTLAGLISLLGHWGNDDPYITFRYASNLLAGNGLVYNVGQRTLSTTAPLYAVVLAGAGLIWPDLPTLSNSLSAVALVLSAGVLFGWSKARNEPAVGMVAALVLSLSPGLLTTFGAETCLFVMLVLAGLYAYDRSRLDLAAGALALAAMIRPDGLVAAVAVGAYHLIRQRSIPWRPVLLYTGLVGAWYLGLWLYYGSPVPVTLLAKQRQGQMAISTRFGTGFLNLIRNHGRQPLYWLLGALAVVGLGQILTRARHWIPLLMWTVFYFLAYTLLGVSSYPWYYAPLAPASAVLVAEGSVALVRVLARTRLSHPLVVGLAGLLLIIVLAPFVRGAIWAGWWSDPRLEVYQEIGQWLEEHTPAEATVGALEVGIMGYYARRSMVDFAGLIQPDVANQLTSGSTFLDSADWAIRAYEPDYVVMHQPDFAKLTECEWFQGIYVPVRDFANKEALWLTLYRRSESQ
jgi:hypothetical protein